MAERKYDLTSIVANVEKVKEMKQTRPKRATTSTRPLKFETDPDDSPLKTAIIEKINERDLTYSDIYNYCTKLKGGDTNEGQKYGYNIINGLRKRHTMIDTTLIILCDFLNLDIMLVNRHTGDNSTEEVESDPIESN